ncbi:MAG: DUF1015 family protein [Verrucomicrobiae bacterium]|nr:DUF1015 family protein [Verrucomicrobiae bacterium]
MADVRPFAAVRARSAVAARVCCPPYDVVSLAEARALTSGNPVSFLRVTRPEVDFPDGIRIQDPEIYRKARENFLRLISDGLLAQEARACYYVYRLTLGPRSQTGLVGLIACKDYTDGVVRPHELTRAEKEDDRARHIQVVGAQTGPALLVYRGLPELKKVLLETSAVRPETEFVDERGVKHETWVIDDTDLIERVRALTTRISRVYIADGHHRTAAAVRVCFAMGGGGGSDAFLGVMFAEDELQILPYNRLVREARGWSGSQIVEQVGKVMQMVDRQPGSQPGLHEVDLYVPGQWSRFRFRDVGDEETDPLKVLDVVLLQEHVLGPLFGISDPRRDPRIDFVGGLDAVETLVRRVDSGEFVCGFAMHPTRIEDMMDIADEGRLLPPKSTWFEPKLRDGLFVHMFSPHSPGMDEVR